MLSNSIAFVAVAAVLDGMPLGNRSTEPSAKCTAVALACACTTHSHLIWHVQPLAVCAEGLGVARNTK